MPRPPPAPLLEFLLPYPGEVVDVVLALRERVREVMPNAHEVVWDATNAVAIGYGSAARTNDGVVPIAIYAKHVNLGFH